MKRYKLLQDLPFVKAGAIFRTINDYGTSVLAPEDCNPRRHMLPVNEIQNFDEWFEEVQKPETLFRINYFDNEVQENELSFYTEYAIKSLKLSGNYFKTREEAEEHYEWLKARATLLKDTKGFKPDWNNENEWKYYVEYDFNNNEFLCSSRRVTKHNDIFFASKDNLKYSLEVHEEEWKIYLGVE